MRTITDYLESAKARNNCKSDRQLATFLAISPTTLFNMQRKRHWPSDELMVRIAKAAGMDEQAALLDLCIWRSGQGLARSAYVEMARRLGKSAAGLFLAGALGAAALALGPSPAAAAKFAAGTERAQGHLSDNGMYIMENRRRRILAYFERRSFPGIAEIAHALCRIAMRLSQPLMIGGSPALRGVLAAVSYAVHPRNAVIASF